MTTWTRLETSTRDPDPGPGMEARLYDPLWSLGRQWQLGEFAAIDGGTPTVAVITVNQAQISRYAAGVPGETPAPTTESINISNPLGPRIERELIGPDLRLRAQLGRDLVRVLTAAGRAADATRLATTAPLTSDSPHAAGLIAVLAGRIPDAAAVRAVMDSELAAADTTLRPILEAWRGTYDARVPPAPTSSWRPDKQERSFSIQAPGVPTLTAADARGAPLDWWAFDADPTASLGAAPAGTSTTVTTVPRLARYAGMPVTRFWQYEDSAVSFGEITVDPRDLGRMLLIDFALTGADDWHVIPLPLGVGTVATVAQLRVTDTFGRTTDVASVDDGSTGSTTGTASIRWRMFLISTGDDEALPLALVAPTPGAEQLGSPIEDLRLTRDEQADLGWAIAATVPSGRGDGSPVDAGPVPSDPQPVAPAVRAYVVQTPVPAGWTPLVPQPTATDGVQLARGTLAADPAATPPGALTNEITALREEVLPTAGLTVLRRWHYARWIDGSVHAWIGREVVTGSGEPDSKLAYDRLV
ncbi:MULTISPECIES: hypothetical protein [unclassified Mycolicibacterium]|uniref:hypothetical protein n=1 Tax=unclassified Mycolicibacterium TaxID=2636767 RepID=UPI002ED9DFF5